MLAAQRNKLIVDTNDLDSLRKQLSQINNSIEQLTQVPTVLPTFAQIISKMENSELLQNNGN
jgi:Asp-tRNA(Asn)/Glu-tRNA(Gln) amidotransferase C subunit